MDITHILIRSFRHTFRHTCPTPIPPSANEETRRCIDEEETRVTSGTTERQREGQSEHVWRVKRMRMCTEYVGEDASVSTNV